MFKVCPGGPMSFPFKQHLLSAFYKQSTELGTGVENRTAETLVPTVTSLPGAVEVPMRSPRGSSVAVNSVPTRVTYCPSLPRTEGAPETWG